MSDVRLEHDTLGAVEVPADALYGPQTARAVANFPISGRALPATLIQALAEIKAAVAASHGAAGRLPAPLADAIEQAAEEVIRGDWADQFPVDVLQTGSGTSSNMNMNEVLARRAQQLLASDTEQLVVHPNDHVNLGQSSNDVFPSALHLAALRALHEETLPAVQALAARFHSLADKHFDALKTGRTHLMDAMPIRFGQVFRGYAQQCALAAERLQACAPGLAALALGGTAVGTGVNAPKGMAEAACARLAERTGLPVHPTRAPFAAQSSMDSLTELSGCLRNFATSLYKIVNDLRWMASGPTAGLDELTLPTVQPGSSIMPAKVNPVICESALMACVQVQGLDHAVALANSQGQFELNTMLPLIGVNVLDALQLMQTSCRNLDQRLLADCAPKEATRARVDRNPILVTALAPEIGYAAAAALGKEALATGRSVRALAEERTDLSAEKLDALLDPARLAGTRGRTRDAD